MTATVETRRRSTSRRRHLTPWMMLAPGIVLFTVFMAAPILYTFVLSFQKEMVKGLGLGSGSRSRTFAGLENYVATLTDPEFLASVGRVLVYGLILVPTMLGLALLFALLLDARRTGAKGFSRVSIFLPYAVPAVISSLLWGFLYLPAVSPFYWIFEQLGWDDVPVAALARPRHLRDREHRPLGRRRLQHDRDVHVAEGRADRDLRGGTHRRGIRGADRAGASRCRSSCPRSS